MFKKIIAVFALLSLVFCFSACSNGLDLGAYISQSRADILEGENENYSVQCYSETREKPLEADGKKENVYSAVIIKLTVKNGDEKIESGVKVNFKTDKEYSSTFVFHPESNTYVATCFVDVLPERSLDVNILKEGSIESIKIASVLTTDTASPLAAVSFAQKKCADLLKSEQFENGNFEINVRLISDDGKLYYYVGFITKEETEALLISHDASKLIARKTLKNR